MSEQLMQCDCCDYIATDGDDLLSHFQNVHPVEWNERAFRKRSEPVEPQPFHCGCGDFHTVNDRCGPF